MLHDGDEALVVVPIVLAPNAVVAWADALEDVALGDADEGEDLVDVGEPEDARNDDLVAGETLRERGRSAPSRPTRSQVTHAP